MNIFFDNIIFSLQKSGGGSVYWFEIINRFSNHANVSFVETKGKMNNIFRNKIKLNNIFLEKRKLFKLNRYFNVKISQLDKFIFHSSYYRVCKQKNAINVVTVYDFTHEKYSKGLPRFIHRFQKSRAIHCAEKIICISNNTKEDLINYYPTINKNKIHVIYPGVNEIYNVIPKEKIDNRMKNLLGNKKYILFVGHRTSYKNFTIAAEAVSLLDKSFSLAIVGQDLEFEEKQRLDKLLGDRYLFLGSVTNEELKQIYNLANCLIYPSSYEGFGIPVLEAMRCKLPVVALRGSSITEIAEGYATLIDNIDSKLLAETISFLQTDTKLKKQIEKAYAYSFKYSWDNSVNEIMQIYKELS